MVETSPTWKLRSASQGRHAPIAAAPHFAFRVFLGVVLATAAGCSLSSTFLRPGWTPVSPVPPDQIDSTVLLVGDAGLPALDHPEPVLRALHAEASQEPAKTAVVFLGDNIYPDGMPAAEDAQRQKAEAVLRAQIDAVQESGARGIFVPGNHDHYSGGPKALRRQADFIRDVGDPRIEYAPQPGCPGPESIDVGTRARLIALDSQWWFDGWVPAAECSASNTDEIVAALRAALTSAGDRHAIVIAHHPLGTHGWHGGHFDWRDHLFPLSRVSSVLWIPLPLVGSLYPLWRTSGRVKQDVSSSHYERMVEHIERSFDAEPPLMHAAGHDHNLQVLVGETAKPWILVSGAGSIERTDPLGDDDDTVAASPFAGFFRLDLLHDGRARLEMVEVHKDGRVERPWSSWIHDGAPALEPQN